MTTEPQPLPRLSSAELKPYLSVVILRALDDDINRALSQLRRHLQRVKLKSRAGRTAELVADGLLGDDVQVLSSTDDSGVRIDLFATRTISSPSWATADSRFSDIRHDLFAWITYEDLIAVHCDASMANAIQRWLDKPPMPPFRRVDPGILNAAFLGGEARALWLKGAHARRSTKADAKNLSGVRLQDALSPVEDSSYGLNAVQAELKMSDEFATLTGVVGLTPAKSKVWLSSVENFAEFVFTATDLLKVIHATMLSGDHVTAPYPWLATEVSDLLKVRNAFAIGLVSTELLPPDDVSEELELAASVLERAVLNVTGRDDSADFVMDVGLDGRVGGMLKCAVTQANGRIRMAFGFHGDPSDLEQVRAILDALEYPELITVYYASGHAISCPTAWSVRIGEAEFPGWMWEDFSGYEITAEKPAFTAGKEIHEAISTPEDVSLFSWVVAKYGDLGWLACDDGANEVADFILLEDNENLSLIHVKGASTTSPDRRTKVTAYEVVTSQATKNLVYLEPDQLISVLESRSADRLSTWYHGRRADRTEFMEYLKIRSPEASSSILIVQPQMTMNARESARQGAHSYQETLRIRLLETLLNTARGAAVAFGSELRVVGAR